MSRGMWSLLDLIRWHWRTHGERGCFPKIRSLALRFQVCAKTIKNWTRKLADLGHLRKMRRGRASCLYMPVENAVGPVGSSPFLGASYPSELPLERGVSITELKTENKTKQAVPKSEPKPTPPRWSLTEREAVGQSIARFRYTSGLRCNPEPILGRLERIAAFYSANGHRVAAEFDHVYERVRRSPSTAPEKAVWFMAVLEARLKRKSSKPVERAPSVTLRRYGVSEEYKSNQEAMRMNEETRRDLEKRRAIMEQEFAALQAKEKKDEGRMVPPKFIGWSAEEMAAHYQELDEFLDFQAKGGTMAEFLQLPGHGAGEPAAQSPDSSPTPEPDKREWFDTGPLVAGIAGGKVMPEGIKRESLEALYAAVKSA